MREEDIGTNGIKERKKGMEMLKSQFSQETKPAHALKSHDQNPEILL
jgi:hypothetical protein